MAGNTEHQLDTSDAVLEAPQNPAAVDAEVTDLVECNQELAKLTFQRRNAERMILIDEHSSAFKWLMASLLTINSGALFGLVNAGTRPELFNSAALSFWIGIAAALGVAWRSQVVSREYVRKLAEVEQAYAVASIYGFIDFKDVDRKENELKTITGISAQFAGWCSFAAFSLGLLLSLYQ